MYSLVEKAEMFARKAHEGQMRKYTGVPYSFHCRDVAERVRRRGGDDEQIAAAWLHDTVEDCGTLLSDISFVCGENVAALVRELTDEYTKENYPHLNREQRKQLEAIRLGGISARAKLIKLCDIADNTSDIVDNAPAGFAALYLREKARVLEAMGFQEEDTNERE